MGSQVVCLAPWQGTQSGHVCSFRRSPRSLYYYYLILLRSFVEELVAPQSRHQLKKLNKTPNDSKAVTALPTARLLVLVSLDASARELSHLLP